VNGRVVGVVLAGGASRRLGRDKRLLPYRGGTVLSATVERLLATPVDGVVVVLGHDEAEVRARAGLPEDARLRLVSNPDWEEGMASSLRRGLAEAEAGGAAALLVALADQPEVEPEGVARLIEAWRSGAVLALPLRAGQPGQPVLFSSPLFDELRAVRGDVGARDVVRRHWAAAAKLEAPLLPDVDTEADYQGLLEREGRG
jgi:CTP:molybdopterin cytidylyltransferase MocA